MRKRVFLKSPVRENRTPGSVRGLLGNWQSYRDSGCSLRSHPLNGARDAIAQFARRGRSRCSPLRSLDARLGRSLRSRWPYAA